MADPLVSVVIPFFEGEGQLRRALSSVLAQTLDDFEVIVVSDGSPHVLAWLESDYPQVKLVRLSDNVGPGSARNAGIEHASGRLIAFLDSDDWWYPNKLQVQTAEMLEAGASWSHHPYDIVRENGELVRRVSNENLIGNVHSRTLRSFRVQTSCMLFDRRVFYKDGLRFSRSRIGEDDALYRATARLYPLHRSPHVLSAFRYHSANAGFSPTLQLWSTGETAEILSPQDREVMARADRLAYWWSSRASRVLGIAGYSPPPRNYRRLLAAIAYAPAWLLLHRPIKEF